ncbi:MAG TPA: hypothetical protein PLD47_15245 [Aggregatilineales bacterium]|nr:hypothetical protein [Anaerolineales bacterium]HRE49082.1 hypothetical protein [Aggregatilineales bacterium]
MKKTRRRLFRFTLTLLISLLLVEGFLRLAYPRLPQGIQIALRFVRLTPFSDQRLAPLPLWQSDRHYQMIAMPDVRDSRQAGSINAQFTVNTYRWWIGRVGFRSPQPENGRVEALALGDSHTFCYVDDADCYVTRLSALLGVSIANFGQTATGSVSHERLYTDFVANLPIGQPALVIWQFYGNDFNDDYGLALLNGTNKTAPPPETIRERSPFTAWLVENSALAALIDFFQSAADYALFVDPYGVSVHGQTMLFGRPYLRASFDLTEPRNQEGEELTYAAVRAVRGRVEGNGGRFVMILMPTKEEVYRSLTAPILGAETFQTLETPRLRMADFCQREGIAYLDLSDVLGAAAARGELVFFPDDIHLNPLGNRLVAEAIAAWVRDR